VGKRNLQQIDARQPNPSLEPQIVGIEELEPATHGSFICYPGIDLRSFPQRKKQLEKIGAKDLILEGSSKIGKFGVLGKGCVSIVVKARLEGYRDAVALKIRRVDANRPDMLRDFELQKFANSFGVGPEAINASKDLFAMEYVDSTKISRWLQDLRSRASKVYTRALIKDMLEQCYLLDINKIDHGELSNPSKHILIRKESAQPKTVVIDFESASMVRQPANLTSVAQFLFMSGRHSDKIRKIVEPSHSLGPKRETRRRLGSFRRSFIPLLRDYKANPERKLFEKILAHVNCL